MTRTLRIAVFALVALAAGLYASTPAEALMAKHSCTFCHSLHGGPTPGGSTELISKGPTSIEALCLGCHLTAVDGRDFGTDTDAVLTAPVQPHRMDDTGSYAEFHVTCIDCHEVHDNMPNWRGAHTDAGSSASSPGTNEKMVGIEDPEGITPFAVIRTKEKDFDRNGIPDRGTVTQNCNTLLVNDCYTTERRYVIFEQARPTSSLHAWADNDEDGLDPINIGDGGPGPNDPTVIRSNESDSGALVGGSKNWSAFDSTCQMCHTQTAPNHNLLTGGGLTHNNGRACTDCHVHELGFDRGNVSTVAQTATRDLQIDLLNPTPNPVIVGNTVTINVDVTNNGTRDEAFDVRYFSNIEGYLGASRVGPLAASASSSTSLDWVTTTIADHTIKVDVEPVIHETVIDNNYLMATVSVTSASNHDVAVTSVTAPGVLLKGDTATVSVDIANPGTFTETFNVTLVSNLDGTIQTLSSGALAAGGTATLNFSWNTTGASLGTHTLTATAAHDGGDGGTDSNAANDSASTTSTVSLPVHDVAVDSVTAPASTTLGNTAAVDVVVSNPGTFTETFNVTLVSNLNGAIQTLSSGALAPGGSTTLNFSWNTTGATIATHTLTATAAHDGGDGGTDSNAANDSASTTAAVSAPVHDVAVDSVTAPASTVQGNVAAVDVVVSNPGDFTETFNVTLASNLDGTIQTLSSGALAPGGSTTLNFSWNTTGATVATHTLTATAATVTGETITGNNSASTTADVAPAGPINDLAVTSITFNPPSPINTCGSRSTINVIVRITNEGTATESNFFVSLASDNPDVGNFPDQQVTSLAAGAFTDVTFNWNFGRNDSCGAMNFTSTVTIVPGETDTTDNSLTAPVTIQ